MKLCVCVVVYPFYRIFTCGKELPLLNWQISYFVKLGPFCQRKYSIGKYGHKKKFTCEYTSAFENVSHSKWNAISRTSIQLRSFRIELNNKIVCSLSVFLLAEILRRQTTSGLLFYISNKQIFLHYVCLWLIEISDVTWSSAWVLSNAFLSRSKSQLDSA